MPFELQDVRCGVIGLGAEVEVAIGWVIVGGLGMVAVFMLFLTPAACALVSGLTQARASSAEALDEESRNTTNRMGL